MRAMGNSSNGIERVKPPRCIMPGGVGVAQSGGRQACVRDLVREEQVAYAACRTPTLAALCEGGRATLGVVGHLTQSVLITLLVTTRKVRPITDKVTLNSSSPLRAKSDSNTCGITIVFQCGLDWYDTGHGNHGWPISHSTLPIGCHPASLASLSGPLASPPPTETGEAHYACAVVDLALPRKQLLLARVAELARIKPPKHFW